MFKPCPNCGFLVAVIAGREASQRCPRCGSALFDDEEIAHTAEAKPSRPPVISAVPADEWSAPKATGADRVATRGDSGAGDDPAVREERAPAPPGAALPVDHAPPPAMDARERPAAPGIDGAAVDAVAAEGEAAVDEPSFTGRRAARRTSLPPGHRLRWAVGLTTLALVLAVQLLLAQRVELAQDARWRPVVTAACAVSGCEVPAWREPERFAMLARNVQPAAGQPGVLHVTATLRNDARWPQSLPVVVLSLSDVEGRMVGARSLVPSDYAARPGQPVAPGESIDLAFDVREPSPAVVAFDFALQ